MPCAILSLVGQNFNPDLKMLLLLLCMALTQCPTSGTKPPHRIWMRGSCWHTQKQFATLFLVMLVMHADMYQNCGLLTQSVRQAL